MNDTQRPSHHELRRFDTHTTRIGSHDYGQTSEGFAVRRSPAPRKPRGYDRSERGFFGRDLVGVGHLVEWCPVCEGSGEPPVPPLDDTTEVLYDAGDSNLRDAARESARLQGYVKTEMGPVHISRLTEPRPCPHCGGRKVVPALPLDLQPHRWLYELVAELEARLSEARRGNPDDIDRWRGRLEAVSQLLKDLPNLPPEAWWGKSMTHRREEHRELGELYDQLEDARDPGPPEAPLSPELIEDIPF